MELVSWETFAATGRVEDYLRYKGEDGGLYGTMCRQEETLRGQAGKHYGRDDYGDGYGAVCYTGGRI